MLLCPNVVVNIHNEMTRKAKLFNLGTLKRLVFALNVGQRDGKTFIGGPQNGGNHWVLVDVELRPFVKIIYCDTLAWQPPPDIIDVVNDFVRYIPQVGMFKKSHLVLAHSPSATNWQGHECDWRCRNYALQNCSDICGVITLVNAAVVTLCSPLFQWLTGPMIRELIRVLMSWFAEGRIEIDYVLHPVGWSGKNPEKSDHTFCSRPNNATKSSLDRPPPKKSPPSAANLSPVKSSPLSSSPTQCNETKPSQCSGKHPLPKCKPTDGNVAVSSPISCIVIFICVFVL